MDGGAWWAAVHGVTKSRTRLSDFPFTFHFHALEKEMATHSSVLAWRIPGTGQSGGLPSMGSQQSRTRLKRLSRSIEECSTTYRLDRRELELWETFHSDWLRELEVGESWTNPSISDHRGEASGERRGMRVASPFCHW